jgi:hypothetical protein
MGNDILRSFDLEDNHEYLETQEGNPLITPFNQRHGYQAIRNTYHTTLQATPCQLVFGIDMIHNIAFISTGIEYKNENRTLSISPISKKTRVEFLMNIRLETKC